MPTPASQVPLCPQGQACYSEAWFLPDTAPLASLELSSWLMAFLTPILGPDCSVLTQTCPHTILSSKAQSQAVSSLPTLPPSSVFLGHLFSTNPQLHICPNGLPLPQRAPNCLHSLKIPTSLCGGGVLSRSSSPYSEVPKLCKSLVFCLPLSIPFSPALLWDPFQSVPGLLSP